jgi:hypothetical protein
VVFAGRQEEGKDRKKERKKNVIGRERKNLMLHSLLYQTREKRIVIPVPVPLPLSYSLVELSIIL